MEILDIVYAFLYGVNEDVEEKFRILGTVKQLTRGHEFSEDVVVTLGPPLDEIER